MPEPRQPTLTLSHQVLRVLIKLNWVWGVLILALLIASIVAGGPVLRALGFTVGDHRPMLFFGARMIMVIGVVAVVVTHVVLTRLLAIVETVRVGDPFIIDNAQRLKTIGWAVLGLELMHLAVGFMAMLASSEAAPIDINWSFSMTRWLAVLLLFVLARVFEQGARMRGELEGTI